MKNVEIITNIGWLLLIFFTRDRSAEARYKVPKTEMINTGKKKNNKLARKLGRDSSP